MNVVNLKYTFDDGYCIEVLNDGCERLTKKKVIVAIKYSDGIIVGFDDKMNPIYHNDGKKEWQTEYRGGLPYSVPVILDLSKYFDISFRKIHVNYTRVAENWKYPAYTEKGYIELPATYFVS